MSDKTYIELCKNSKSTVQINIYRGSTGVPFMPSGAYFEIKGRMKDNVIIPRSPANVYQNQVWAKVTQAVTASAAEYDLYWELRRDDGDITPHCTKILVIDTC